MLCSLNPRGKIPWYTFYLRMHGSQSHFNCGGEEKNSNTATENETLAATLETDLSQTTIAVGIKENMSFCSKDHYLQNVNFSILVVNNEHTYHFVVVATNRLKHMVVKLCHVALHKFKLFK
jgi:hypothetical protein